MFRVLSTSSPRSSWSFRCFRAPLLLGIAGFLAGAGAAQSGKEKLAEAWHLYRDLKDEEALVLVNDFLLDEGTLHPEGVELRARCLIALQRPQDAVDALQKLPERADSTTLVLAEALALSGQPDAALELLDGILVRDSENMNARVKRAKVMLTMGRFQQALNELNVILQLDPQNPEVQLVAGMAYEGLRSHAQAAAQYRSLLMEKENLRPLDTHDELAAVEGLARVNNQAGKYADAIHWYRQLADQFPDKARYVYQMATCQAELGDDDEALANLKKALEMEPDSLEFRFGLGEFYRINGQWDEAAEQYEILAENAADPSMPTLRLAQVYLRKGDLQRALVQATLLEKIATEPEGFETVGEIKEKVGDPDGAKAAYRRALELDPLHRCIIPLARLLAESSDPGERAEGTMLQNKAQRAAPYFGVIGQLNLAVRSNPRDVTSLAKLAAYLNSAGEYELARKRIEQTLALNPTAPDANAFAGFIAANQLRDQDALRYFEQAMRLYGRERPDIEALIAKIKEGEPLALPLGVLPPPEGP